MLTDEQRDWFRKKTNGFDTNTWYNTVSGLFNLGRNYYPVDIEIHGDNITLYCKNKFAMAKSIEEAAELLIEKIHSTPDPDPYLTECLVNALAPGDYFSWPDKVAAAEQYSKATAPRD